VFESQSSRRRVRPAGPLPSEAFMGPVRSSSPRLSASAGQACACPPERSSSAWRSIAARRSAASHACR